MGQMSATGSFAVWIRPQAPDGAQLAPTSLHVLNLGSRPPPPHLVLCARTGIQHPMLPLPASTAEHPTWCSGLQKCLPVERNVCAPPNRGGGPVPLCSLLPETTEAKATRGYRFWFGEALAIDKFTSTPGAE